MALPQDKSPVATDDVAETAISVRPYAQASRDPRALRILAKTIYREMRQGGLVEEDVMSVAGELLSLVAGDMKDRRAESTRLDSVPPRSAR